MDFDSLVDDQHRDLKPEPQDPPLSFDELQDDEERYGDAAGMAKSFGLGAARSASFGFSDEFLTQTGLLKPEEIAAYRETNPISSGAGEVAGVLGAVLAPEAGLLGAAAAPVKGVAKLGGAVTEALAPAATSSAVGKILGQAGAYAAGSAVEGAAYGLGQSVTEHALGDPDLNAEKVFANVGTGALVGGALGSLFGAAKGAIQVKYPKFLSEVDKAGLEVGDWPTMVRVTDNLSESEKNGFVRGLTKRKGNAKEIEAAAKELGDAPVLPGMVSDSKLVQDGQSALLTGPPTVSSMRAQGIAAKGLEKVEETAQRALGAEADVSKASLGDSLKGMVAKSIEDQVAPINAVYDELKSRYATIPLSDKSAPAIAKNILKLDEVRISPSSPEAKLAKRVAEEIQNLKTVDDVKNYRSLLSRSSAPEERHMVAILSEKLAALEENSVLRFARDKMKTDVAKDKIKSLLDMREAANAQYTVFRDKLGRLGEVLGRKKIYGARDFLSHLDNLTPEKIAERLSGKNNAEFLSWFANEFPEGMAAISQYQKGLIREAAMKDGKLNIGRVISEIKKMSPEYKAKIFSADELKKLQAMQTYFEAFPKNFNPSNTANASAFRAFFESPLGAAVGNARDIAIEGFINAAASSGDNAKMFIDGLSAIERTAVKTTKTINSGASAIFSAKEAGSPVKGYLAISSDERKDDHDKIQPKISELNSDPLKMIDKLERDTEQLIQIAPNTSAAMQGTILRATQFLNSKLPQGGPRKPLSPVYKPSKAELAKWHKYYSVIDRPTDALRQVASGTLTPETMETLSVVYPRLLQEMQVAVTDKMTDAIAKKKTIPYRTKLSLSMFLGQDLVNSLEPANILSVQNTLATATQAKAAMELAQKSGVNGKNLDKMNKSNRLMTPMQESAQRGKA